MKTKLTLAILALLCAITLSAKPQSQLTRWEYKFQFQCDEKKANVLAAEGWELVNMTASGSGMTTAVNCAFKRPKS
jgi:hypothetical protein